MGKHLFGAVYAAEGTAPAALEALVREFSPRFELHGSRDVTFDLNGLTRLFGDGRAIADVLRHTGARRGLRLRVAIAGTRTAARLLAHATAGVTVIDPGTETAAVAALSLELLAAVAPLDLATLRQWGLRTCGDLASLPSGDIAARLGQDGVCWQRLARGEDLRPLLPVVPEEHFEQSLDLDWPIEGLEPLTFVLGRLLEPLSAHLERRDRGAAVLHVRLHLVTRHVHERSLQLPVPMRDPRTLRTLALLDLESHPPAAAIDRVVVEVEPTPGRVIQGSLLARPLPPPEQISTLMARLTALMGEGRCGTAGEVDSWRPGACAVHAFAPDATASTGACAASVARPPSVALRRFRFPVPIRVRLEAGRPARLTTDRRGLSGGHIETAAGPWRMSGGWWERGGVGGARTAWDREEWDVTLTDGATYRLFRDRHADAWFIDGSVD